MPHLRIVSDALWYRANKQIDDRQHRKDIPSGADHPLFGIPRDSRGPLTKVFVCGCCMSKMHQCGRSAGGYRCSTCRKAGGCWNKATALREDVHQILSQTISNAVLSKTAVIEVMVPYIKSLYADTGATKLKLESCVRRYEN